MNTLDLLNELLDCNFIIEKHYYKEDLDNKQAFVARLTILKDYKEYVNAFGVGPLNNIEEIIKNTEELLYKKLLNEIKKDFFIIEASKEYLKIRYSTESIFKPYIVTSTDTSNRFSY